MFPRNPGPFWEAGGFGIFLSITYAFNLLKTKNIFDKKNIIFLIALLTTQSTGSYFTVFFTIFTFLAFSKKISYVFWLIPIFITIISYAYTEIPFLEEKVNQELSLALDPNYKLNAHTRFVSARLDIDNFIKHPLTGQGRYNISEVKDTEDFHAGKDYRNNGTTQLLAEFGIFGFFFYFFYYFKTFRAVCKSYNFNKFFGVFMVFTSIIAGFSQTIFAKPFFISLCFIFIGLREIPRVKKKFHSILKSETKFTIS